MSIKQSILILHCLAGPHINTQSPLCKISIHTFPAPLSPFNKFPGSRLTLPPRRRCRVHGIWGCRTANYVSASSTNSFWSPTVVELDRCPIPEPSPKILSNSTTQTLQPVWLGYAWTSLTLPTLGISRPVLKAGLSPMMNRSVTSPAIWFG